LRQKYIKNIWFRGEALAGISKMLDKVMKRFLRALELATMMTLERGRYI